MEGKGWGKIGPKRKVEGQQANKLTGRMLVNVG
jgi:hypothetical protein